MADIKSVLDTFPDYVRMIYASQDLDETKPRDETGCCPVKRASVVFSFSEKGFGFGEIALVVDADGQHYLDTECMSLDRVKHFLGKLLDGAITDVETDPEKHRKYNEFMGCHCGESCPMCYPPKP